MGMPQAGHFPTFLGINTIFSRRAVAEFRATGVAIRFPQDVTLRNRATEGMQKAQPGTPLHRFYESLARRAEDNIREARARDEEMDA
jgi:hypothetical protein